MSGPRLRPPRTVVEWFGAGLVLLVTAVAFLAPILDGDAFTAVGARRADNYPWAAYEGGPPQPAQADQADLSRPWQHQMSGAVRDGTLAFWNPDTFAGGSPLFSNGSSAVMWPPRLLVSLLSERWAHDAYSFIHLLLWGLAMYGLVRELGGSWAAGVIGGVAWQLGAFNLGWLHLEVVAGMPLALPLGLWVVYRSMRRRRWSTALGGGLVLGAVLGSGHVLWHLITFEFVGVVALALAGCEMVRRRGLRPRTRVLGSALWPVAPLGVAPVAAGVVLVPTALTLSGTPRAPFSADLVAMFVGPARTLADLVRAPSTDPMTTTVLNSHLGFVGTVTVVLAVVGLATRRRGVGPARGIIAAGLGIALVAPVARLAYRLIPGFDVFYPYTRLLGWVAFGLVLAAALGTDAVAARAASLLQLEPGRPRRRALAAGATALVVLATTLQMVPLGRRLNPPFPARDGVADTFDATPLITAARSLPERDGASPLIAPITRDYVNMAPVGPPMLWANHATLHGLLTTSGYDSTLPAPASRLLRLAAGDSLEQTRAGLVGAFVPLMELGRANPTVLRRLGVTHLAVVPEIRPDDPALARFGVDPTPIYDGPDGRILELVDPEPTLRVEPRPQVADDDTTLAHLADPSRPRGATIAADGPGDVGRLASGAPAGTGPGAARMVERSRHHLTVEASGSGGLLVLPLNWDAGWSATVTPAGDAARSAPVVRADVARAAVAVPQGDVRVELHYRPAGLPAGAALSLVALAAWCIALVVERRRAGRPGGGPRVRPATAQDDGGFGASDGTMKTAVSPPS